MSERTIYGIYRGAGFHWVGDGFRVTNYFPSSNDLGSRISPYILLDYHTPFLYPPAGDQPRGVGTHPHRGFETVTLAFEGSVAHHDSFGHSGVIGPGDVQWMTAASGILHKEYHEREFARNGGSMHMAQIWINLPKAHKMDPPRYQSISSSQIGVVELPGEAGLVRVIAGEYQGVKGPARTYTPVRMFDIQLNPEGRAEFSCPAGENTALLVLQGDLHVNGGSRASALDLVLFENQGEEIAIQAETEARLLLLNGEPIDEPVVQYGPFVMNTQQEIRQAMIDFQSGRFGHLE
ncbi:MAG TPA: pirin family protein [Bryobacteraceae bacterium]|nr:pirin family protein [Bryobacteraceae bacterium]